VTEIGNRLKEARQEKGLSLDDLQSITKIQKRYLMGIEEGNYSSMPGNFYVRAFIKQYAEALELNPDELFEAYKSEIPSTYSDDLPEQLSRVQTQRTISDGSSKVFDLLPKILIAVFVIGAASLIYFLVINYGKKSSQSINQDTAQTKIVQSEQLQKAKTKNKDNNTKKNNDKKDNAKVDNPPPPPEVTPPPQELAVVSSSGINATYSLKNADKFQVKVVSKGETWVSIKNGQGKSYFQGTLSTNGTPDQTVDLSSDSEAVIVVGRAVDTDIYINDQKLEYAISPTDAVRQNITIQYVPKNK
jgi:cytoskeletal protein RodZ